MVVHICIYLKMIKYSAEHRGHLGNPTVVQIGSQTKNVYLFMFTFTVWKDTRSLFTRCIYIKTARIGNVLQDYDFIDL